MNTTRAYATVTGPTALFVTTDGRPEPIEPTGDEDIRRAVVRRATDEARRTGIPVELVTRGDHGEHHLLIGVDGTLAPLPTISAAEELDDTVDRRPPAVGWEAEVAELEEQIALFGEEVREQAPPPATGDAAPAPVAESPRVSFLTPPASTAESGWRGWWARLGLTPGSSPAAQARERAAAAVARQWAGCRTIAVANGKGGVGKTMTTAMLAAVYARSGGGNVLAWDNNDTRGTLGWRTEPGLYPATIRDLLHHADALLAPDAAVSDIARFVHHQPDDRYDVLRSNPELLAADQRLTTPEFDQLMTVAARYYRVVVFDSGNDESADRWLRMIDSTHQLAIPTLATPESAESAALLLDALRTRDHHSSALALSAVVIVTQSEPAKPKDLQRLVDGFEGLVRAVHVIPYDPALKGGPLRFDTLRPTTRDAWMRAAAATSDGL